MAYDPQKELEITLRNVEAIRQIADCSRQEKPPLPVMQKPKLRVIEGGRDRG